MATDRVSQFGAWLRAPSEVPLPDAKASLPDAEMIDAARAIIEAQVLLLNTGQRVSQPQLMEALELLAGKDEI